MSTRTGRVVRWVRSNGTRYAVIEPHLSPAEVEEQAAAILASLPDADRRAIEAERLKWALARVRARSDRKRRTGQTRTRERAPVVHRPPDWCSVGGCDQCDERVRP